MSLIIYYHLYYISIIIGFVTLIRTHHTINIVHSQHIIVKCLKLLKILSIAKLLSCTKLVWYINSTKNQPTVNQQISNSTENASEQNKEMQSSYDKLIKETDLDKPSDS